MVSPTNFADPRRTLKNLIADNWVAANVPTVGTPDFATEWRDKVAPDGALVTVTNRNDTAISAAGYHAIRGDGSGVVARKRGFVFVNCWADEREPGEIGADPNPKQVAEELWNEVDRIVLAAAPAGVGDLEGVRTDGPLETVESTETGVVHRLHGRIEYEYALTPS